MLAHSRLLWLAGVLCLTACTTTPLAAADLKPALAKLQAVKPKGEGHQAAIAAWQTISQAPASDLTTVLAAFDGANLLAENWLRSAVETIAQKHAGKLPTADLELFLKDTKHSPRGRRLAYELLLSADPAAEARLVPTFLNDPSLELRRDAVAKVIAQGEAAGDDKVKAKAAFKTAHHAARDLDQIKTTTEKLKGLEVTYDLPAHFGFLQNWYVLGPFDNKNTRGFDIAYPPEAAGFSANATYEGVGGAIKWIEHRTSDEYGLVDLTKVLAKHKGAIAYAFTEFESDRDQTVQVRLGSINANKLWVNGELLFTNNVYHAGISVDQYSATAKLKKGKNTILLKIAQNEQTEPWAQDWNLQLRICDEVGTAILAKGRVPSDTEAQ